MALLDLLARQVRQVLLGQQVTLVLKDLKAIQDLLVLLVRLGQLEQQALQRQLLLVQLLVLTIVALLL
tara:strand:+ start:25 stop:228 length:204 start_codon:yes stop_codon:yes gene_type:complete